MYSDLLFVSQLWEYSTAVSCRCHGFYTASMSTSFYPMYQSNNQELYKSIGIYVCIKQVGKLQKAISIYNLSAIQLKERI